MTVTGLSFGTVHGSPTSALGGGVCRTTAWSSSTSLACLSAWYVTSQKWGMHAWDTSAVVTVSAMAGTSDSQLFTYDAPMLSAACFSHFHAATSYCRSSGHLAYKSFTNVPVTGINYIDLRGSSFGAVANATPSVAIYGNMPISASWTSTTTVLVTSVPDLGEHDE